MLWLDETGNHCKILILDGGYGFANLELFHKLKA
jgi:hypothetical protein